MQPGLGWGRLELEVSRVFNAMSLCSLDGQCLSQPRVFRPPLPIGELHSLPLSVIRSKIPAQPSTYSACVTLDSLPGLSVLRD